MDQPEAEHIAEAMDNADGVVPNVNTAEFKEEYQNVLRLSKKLAESIDFLSKAADANDEMSNEVRDFCLESGIPTTFTKERLLFKKSVMNRIEEQMFTNPCKDPIPGGPDASMLNIVNVANLQQFEHAIEYGPVGKYLVAGWTEEDGEEEGESEAYIEARFIEKLRTATNPLDLVSREYFTIHTPIDLFIAMVKAQFKIRWNTKDGQYIPVDYFTIPEDFQKHRLYNAWLQTKLYESRTLIESRDGDFSDFAVPIFKRVKTNKGRSAKSSQRKNRGYSATQYAWKTAQGIADDFPISWLPPKLKTTVKKHCAEHSSMDYALLRGLNGEEEGDGSEAASEHGSDSEESFGVYMLIIENITSPNKCQIYFSHFESDIEAATKLHEQAISRIAVSICSTENFNYNPELRVIDVLLLLNLIHKHSVACFQVADGLPEDGDAVGIVLSAAVNETILPLNREEEMFLWGAPILPRFGLNSKLELEDLRREYQPTDFPGSER